MKSRRSTELIVGLTVLAGLATILGLTISIRKSLLTRTKTVVVKFDQVNGLEVGSAVLIRGLRVGRVTALKSDATDRENPIKVMLQVPHGAEIYRNAVIKIVQQGFIGDKRIEVTEPGTEASGMWSETDPPLIGEPPFDMERLYKKGEAIVTDLQATVATFKDFVTDDETIAAIRGAIHRIEAAVGKIDGLLTQNEQAINETVANVRETAKNAAMASKRADTVVAGVQKDVAEVSGQVKDTIADLKVQSRQLVEDLNALVGKVDKRSEALTSSATGALDDGRAEFLRLSENLRQTSTTLNELLEGVRNGEGTVGALFNDQQPFRDLRDAIEAVRTTLLGERGALYDTRIRYRPAATPAPAAAAPKQP